MTELRLHANGFTIHIYCDDVEAVIDLDEAQHRGVPLTGPYSASYHTAKIQPGEDHLHVYKKGNQIFAINQSGSAHDRSHGVRIPNRVATAIRHDYPNIKLPPNNIIEGISLIDETNWLIEEAGGSK
jgi:hypothetical protein